MKVRGWLVLLFCLSACDCSSSSRCTPDEGCDPDQRCVDGACVQEGGDASLDGASGDAGGSSGDGGAGDGSSAGLDASLGGFCAGRGPIVLVGDQPGESVCTGTVAQTTFRNAVCSCGQFAVSNTFTTDSFDSRSGPYSEVGASHAGSFGTNGSVSLAARFDVGGSARIGGDSGISGASAAADVVVARDLTSNGPIAIAGDLDVGHDAAVDGNVGADHLAIAGRLTQPAGATHAGTSSTSIGSTAVGTVADPLPCACDAASVLDVAAIVGDEATHNDNAEAGFDPDVLDGYASPAPIDLPCGRLYVPSLHGTGDLVLRVASRTALFVAGDFSPGGDFAVQVVGGGELDLFVAGNVSSSNRIDLGSIDAPSRVRFYVGGSQPIFLSGGATFAGNFYAPHASLTMSTAIDVYGSIFADGIVASDRLSVHYDVAILDAGDDCSVPPPSTCDTCEDCGNQACNGGSCGGCAVDADCCWPLLCIAGTCQPSLE